MHLLVAAFEAVADEFLNARLLIVGQAINREYRDELEKQCQASSVGERVLFQDPMPQPELAQCMAQARVLVLPSSSEGLPRVVFEAMACSTPVIGSAVGGIPDLIEDGETGLLVPPGDAAAVAERLRWVMTHPREAQEMGERARAFARCFFSSAAYVDDHRRMFKLAEMTFNSRQP